MKRTFVYENGAMVEKIKHRRSDSHYVIEDIKPYKSMVDGSMITSRSQHRRHLKQHNCIEVGNERMENKPQKVKDSRREVLRAQVANMTHDQANRILRQLRDQVRFSNPHRK
jgi:hypothetical protein